VLLVGGFVTCAYAYAAFADLSPALQGLLPNMGTGLLGSWISVRLIDQVIKRRETRDMLRRRLVANLNFLHGRFFRPATPRMSRGEIANLEHEWAWFLDRWPRRSGALRGDERALVEDAIRVGPTLIAGIKTMTATRAATGREREAFQRSIERLIATATQPATYAAAEREAYRLWSRVDFGTGGADELPAIRAEIDGLEILLVRATTGSPDTALGELMSFLSALRADVEAQEAYHDRLTQFDSLVKHIADDILAETDWD